MIRILLKERLSDKAFKERRRVTLNEVSERTGISRPTLTRIANVPGYNTNTDTIDALCDYFDCEPGDLLQRVGQV
ncbi:MAG: helix-turn-helix domain-containing protein [Oceanococcaceae bacterium]